MSKNIVQHVTLELNILPDPGLVPDNIEEFLQSSGILEQLESLYWSQPIDDSRTIIIPVAKATLINPLH